MQQEIEFHLAAQGDVLAEYIDCREPVSMIMGPIGSGKTTASVQRVFTQMTEQEPDQFGRRRSRWIAVRNTYPDLQSTTIKDWCEMYHNEEVRLGRFDNSFPPTHYLDFDLDDGTRVVSELIFLALDRPDSVKKLRGTQVTGFWLNEVKELSKAIVDMCDGRHGRFPEYPSWHGMIGDTNAPDTDHWYYTLAEETKPQGWRFFRQPGGVIKQPLPDGSFKWVPNPKAENIRNLPKNYYMRQVGSKADDWINVNLANNYGHVTTGKPIYDARWSEAKHLSKLNLLPMPRVKKLLLGFDFGRTPACIIGQLMPNGKLRILDELVADGMGIRTFMDQAVMPLLKTKYAAFDLQKHVECYGDPAGIAKSGNDENSPLGILWDEYKLQAWPTATNMPLKRWEAVNYFLLGTIDGAPAFELSPACKVLRKGFNGGYAFRRLNVSGERYADAADKNSYSHPHDALQYLCLGAQGEADYGWRDEKVTQPGTYYSSAADSRTGY